LRNSLRVLLFAASIAVALAFVEGAFRLTRALVQGTNARPTVNDPELGWVHNVKRPVVTRRNSCGEDVTSQPAPSPYLIHRPRDPSHRRILFLGDSSTHAHEVSTGSAYYDVVETIGRGRLSVWAAGVAGYSTLQEYRLLEKVYPEITPEVVVWQLDANDVANNVHRLDLSILDNNVQPRPYLDPATGAVEFGSPAARIFRVSQAAGFLLSRLTFLDRRYDLGIIDRIESWMAPAPSEIPQLTRQGLQVMDTLVAEATRRYPNTRFAGFSVNQEHDDEYAEIFRRHGARYWTGLGARVGASPTRTDCAPLDWHWNHAGNRIAGEMLAALVMEM
jgi:hypothetical protein